MIAAVTLQRDTLATAEGSRTRAISTTSQMTFIFMYMLYINIDVVRQHIVYNV